MTTIADLWASRLFLQSNIGPACPTFSVSTFPSGIPSTMGGLRRSESIHEEGPLLKKRKVKPAFTPKYQGPTKNDILAARKQHLSDGQYTFYKEPLMLVEGAMQYIFDEQVLLALMSSPVLILLKVSSPQDVPSGRPQLLFFFLLRNTRASDCR